MANGNNNEETKLGQDNNIADNVTTDEAMNAATDPNEPLLKDSDIPDTLSAGDFDLDISDEVAQQEQLQEDVRKEMKPTTLERNIQQSLLDIREQADQIEVDQKEEILDLEKSGIGTMAGMNIAKDDISERNSIKLEALQREESNLLDRLGLEQDARETRRQGAEELLKQNKNNIDMAIRIRDRIEQKEKAQRKREEELSSTQKQNLNDFVDMISGVDPSTLEPQTQAEVARLAGETGVPFDAIMSRLQLDYDKRIADLADQTSQKNIAGSIDGTEISNPTMNVIEGVDTLDNLTPTQKSQANTELRQLGFFSEEVPEWFRKQSEQEAQMSFKPEALKEAWNESRQEVIGFRNDDKNREMAGAKATVQTLLAGDDREKVVERRDAIINKIYANSDTLTREEVKQVFDEIIGE